MQAVRQNMLEPEWREEFCVGHTEIDEQHKHIYTLLAAFQKVQSETGTDTADVMFEHIVRYLAWHFSTEEKVMELCNYPLLEEHRGEHQRCNAKLAEVAAASKLSGRIDVAGISEFLASWLEEHLLASDRKLMLYLRSN